MPSFLTQAVGERAHYPHKGSHRAASGKLVYDTGLASHVTSKAKHMTCSRKWVVVACCILGHVVPGVASGAVASVPNLSDTTLYANTVHDCRAVDLMTWRHPTREVLHAARARVEKVELCNGANFPVFTVILPYDVYGRTDDYFNKLYVDLAEANGFWSYALVDIANNVVISVAVERAGRTVSPTYEDFDRPAGPNDQDRRR